MPSTRTHTPTDRLLTGVSKILDTLFVAPVAERPYPGTGTGDELDAREIGRSAAYMRVNHVGEICAQALYQSQALTSRNPAIRERMNESAQEERDHLAWCERRLKELNGRKSLLNPLWYGGSFMIGAVAGLAGDRWSLGFLAETEKQVVQHLETHLCRLPQKDVRSREVVAQMQIDEAQHARQAVESGATDLPQPVKRLMKCLSRVMTTVAYRV